MLKEILIFTKEFIKAFKTTGSVCPTTRWAAKQMVKPLNERSLNQGFKILELGPGTGSVTRWILREMNLEDTLTICEINSRFMESLKKSLLKDQYYLTHKNRIDFHCCPMQDLPINVKFDLIVCAIPFLNLNTPLVTEIFNKISNLSHEKTIMTYYEYIGLRQLGKFLGLNPHKARIKDLDKTLSTIVKNHSLNTKIIWRNFLPIIVYTLKELPELKKTTAKLHVENEILECSDVAAESAK